MYMETKAHMNYWSTDNFCVHWSIRTGSLIIVTLTAIWSALCVAWGVWSYHEACYEPERANASDATCWFMPEPESDTVLTLTPEDTGREILRYGILFVILYHGIYFLCSILVYVGIFKEMASLLAGWVFVTHCQMVLVFCQLVLTLAFTTVTHLLLTLAHLVAALCSWVVVKSQREVYLMAKFRSPVPDHALLDYTVDGVDKIALDPAPR